MSILSIIISLSGLIIVPLIAYISLRGTIFDISNPQQNAWPLLWYYEILLVLVPLVLVSIFGINNIDILFKAKPGTESQVAIFVIITLIIYILSLAIFLRLFQLRARKNKGEKNSYIPQENLIYALAIIALIMLIVFYFLGYKHAFLTSILTKESLLSVRLANKYDSLVPSQAQSILRLIGYLLSALSGYLGKVNLKKSILFLILSIFILSTPGDKAPLVWGLLIWLLALGKLLPHSLFSLKTVFFLISIICIVFITLYFVVSMQIPSLTLEKYFSYLINRLGIGQMAGVYETVGLAKMGATPQGNFYWHMIPGASFFVDYIDFQKILMMVTEGYEHAEMGVKNTYFIAEAYAIGGIPFVFLSPIMVGFSTVLGLILLIDILRKFVGRELAPYLGLMLYFKTQSITGGFSHFPLLKGIILIIIQLFIIWILCIIVMPITKITFKRKFRFSSKKCV